MKKTVAVAMLLMVCQSAIADGILKITSQPPGASINIGGGHSGKTPRSIRLAAGRHIVIVMKDKYDSYLEIIQIEDNKLTELKVTLKPSVIEITVKSKVDDAKVFIDGTEAGLTNEPVMARPGVRELVVVADGYLDSVSHVRIPWKGPKTYTVNPAKGTSFRSGMLDIQEVNWTIRSGWVLEDGVAIFNKGSRADMIMENIKRFECFALTYQFRARNLNLLLPLLVPVGYNVPKNMQDGKWHTVLLEVNKLKTRCKVDGGVIPSYSAPIIEMPFHIQIYARVHPNNDPFYAEVKSIVLKGFKSPQDMAAALRTSVLK